MSHYIVVVTGENIEEQLAPFDEDIQVEPYETVEAETPKKLWSYKHLLEEGLISEDPTPQEIVDAYNTKYRNGEDESDRLHVNADGRICVMSTYNPKSQWDWYSVGGRWTGYFKAKSGVRGETGRPGLMTAPADPGWFDSLLKGEVDWDGMKDDAGRKAAELYDQFALVVKDLPAPRAWKDIQAANGIPENLDDVRDETGALPAWFNGAISQARREYADEPMIKAMRASSDFSWYDPADFFVGQENARARYIENARNRAIAPFAILHKGVWSEKGKMGWWGHVSGEQPEEDWNENVVKFLDGLDDSVRLTAVDCHI